MTEPDPARSATPVAHPFEPPVPLSYAPPVAKARLSRLIIGLVASAFFAVGGGMVAFGIMLHLRNDRDAPPFVGGGVTSIIFGAGVIITTVLARR